MFLGGRPTVSDSATSVIQRGIAYGTNLQSAAIATAWSGTAYSLGFSTSTATVDPAYIATFAVADVINSSYGYSDPAALTRDTFVTDALAYEHFETLHVVAAGNGGPGANTVGGPASGYNSLAVASLGNANAFDQVAGSSSRGPQTFGYYAVQSGSFVPVQIAAARAPVDIAAPGTSLVSAFYGGQTGGNNPQLTGSPSPSPATTDTNLYSGNIGGTSFAAPLVAGGATLAFSAAKTLPELSGNAEARQSVVVRSLLLTGADKTSGWDNGQQVVTVSGTTFLQTTQSLDYAVGAGRMNLATTFDLQLNGQTGVGGTTPGLQGTVAVTGWDYGAAIIGTNNDYILDGLLPANSTLTTTLSWMRPRVFDPVNDTFAELAQADLNLSIWGLGDDDAFTTLIARSASLYNLTEHLSFGIATTGRYGPRVEYLANTFDNTTGSVWGQVADPQDYGLSWSAIPVPEPATVGLAMTAVAVLGWRVSRRPRNAC